MLVQVISFNKNFSLDSFQLHSFQHKLLNYKSNLLHYKFTKHHYIRENCYNSLIYFRTSNGFMASFNFETVFKSFSPSFGSTSCNPNSFIFETLYYSWTEILVRVVESKAKYDMIKLIALLVQTVDH